MDENKKNKLFGQLAVKLGYVTLDDVSEALIKQEADEITGTKKHIGAYFFEDGLLTKEQISQVIQLQKKYIEKLEQSSKANIGSRAEDESTPIKKQVIDLDPKQISLETKIPESETEYNEMVTDNNEQIENPSYNEKPKEFKISLKNELELFFSYTIGIVAWLITIDTLKICLPEYVLGASIWIILIIGAVSIISIRLGSSTYNFITKNMDDDEANFYSNIIMGIYYIIVISFVSYIQYLG